MSHCAISGSKNPTNGRLWIDIRLHDRSDVWCGWIMHWSPHSIHWSPHSINWSSHYCIRIKRQRVYWHSHHWMRLRLRLRLRLQWNSQWWDWRRDMKMIRLRHSDWLRLIRLNCYSCVIHWRSHWIRLVRLCWHSEI